MTWHVGTLLYTWLKGEFIGVDEFSNRYYRNTKAKLHGRERRWVVYKGKPEASKVPAEWHAWLHHLTDSPLTEKAAQALSWQKEHEPNLTGTSNAYRPQGHDLELGRHAMSSHVFPNHPTICHNPIDPKRKARKRFNERVKPFSRVCFRINWIMEDRRMIRENV